MGRLTAALLAASLMISACGSSSAALDDDVTIELERPTRADIPWDETPEQIRSNTKCPADLPVDSITPVDEPAVALTHVAEITEASALAFAPDGTGYVGTRSGSIFRWVEGSEPRIVLDLTESTTTDRDQGLLGLTVANGYLFVNRTDNDDDSANDNGDDDSATTTTYSANQLNK